MKKRSLFLGTLCALAVLAACEKECEECKECENPVDSCAVKLDSGLLAYYPFNGNYNDESGHNLNATSRNGAFLTTDYAGRTNSCAGFDGVNDYFIVPRNSQLNADTITLSVQVLLNSIDRSHTLVNRVNFDNATATVFGLGVALPTDNKFSFAALPNTEDCSKQHSYTESYSLYSNNTIQPGRWYNIVCTFVGGVQKFYINGILQGSATRTFTKAKQCDNADLVIGGWWQSGIISIDGKIDDVRLYKRVLNDCEINKLAETFADAIPN